MSQSANPSYEHPNESSIHVLALYKFVTLEDFEEIKPSLLHFCLEQGIRGTLLLAREGINGTVAASGEAIQHLLAYLQKDPRFADIDYKVSYTDELPFYRMKVKLKKEIVTLGVDGIDPNVCVGQYVEAKDWNDLIADPEVVVVDTRNDYEYDVGTFEGAINPDTEKFTQFPEYVQQNLDPEKHKKVAMFCTGGIRCEKATAYMKQQGFDDVYHLKGGILKYLEDVPQEESLWKGECFVFDNRVTVNHDLEEGSFDMCHGCRYPISAEDKASPLYVPGVCCPHCHDALTDDQKQRFEERQRQMRLASARGVAHIGTEANPVLNAVGAEKGGRASQASSNDRSDTNH